MAEEILEGLMAILEDEQPPIGQVTKSLNAFAEILCNDTPQTRNLVVDMGAYITICRAWMFCCYNGAQSPPSQGHASHAQAHLTPLTPEAKLCRDAILRALYALVPGHAELMDEVGWQIVIQAIDKSTPERTHILLSKLLRNLFIKCEENREHFSTNLGLIPHLVALVFKPKLSGEFLAEWGSAMKALLLTDDERVSCNKCAERKRIIAKTHVLPILAGKLHDKAYENDVEALNSTVIFLSSMAVSDDLCEQIDSGNVIAGIRGIFKTHATNEVLVQNTCTLLRLFCSNRTLREKVSTFAIMKWVMDMINKYQTDRDVVEEGMACCSYMTVRNSCHVAQFIAKNGLTLTMKIMTNFKDYIPILRSSCFVLRNVAENGGLHGKERLKDLGFGILLTQFKSTLLELREFYILPILKEIENIDRESFDSGQPTYNQLEVARTPTDNMALEPIAGRKSVVLDASDDEE